MPVRISRQIVAAIGAHASETPIYEVCGLLYGTRDTVDAAQRCTNVAADPSRCFEVDPAALIAAYKAERAGGPCLVGCYHSHPNGVARPSARDVASAREGDLWVVSAVGTVTGWTLQRGEFHPVELVICEMQGN